MAKKKKPPEPTVRKGFLVTGGIAVGAALLGFLAMTFLAKGGGDGGEAATELAITEGNTVAIPTSEPQVKAGSDETANDFEEGGRDPFAPGLVASTGGGSSSTSSSPSSSSSGGSSASVAQPAPQRAPVQQQPTSQQPVYQPPAYEQPVYQPPPEGEGPAPEEDSPKPNGEVAVQVLATDASSADIQIDDDVYEDARNGDTLTERFNLDEIDGGCVYMKDMWAGSPGHRERFKVCTGDVVYR
jgi:hypothetical protein